MKQLVKSVPEQQLIVRGDLPSQPIIGFVKEVGVKGWVQPDGYHPFTNSSHRLLTANKGVINGSSWSPISGGINAVLNWLEKHAESIYIFDNPAELFKWLSE